MAMGSAHSQARKGQSQRAVNGLAPLNSGRDAPGVYAPVARPRPADGLRPLNPLASPRLASRQTIASRCPYPTIYSKPWPVSRARRAHRFVTPWRLCQAVVHRPVLCPHVSQLAFAPLPALRSFADAATSPLGIPRRLCPRPQSVSAAGCSLTFETLSGAEPPDGAILPAYMHISRDQRSCWLKTSCKVSVLGTTITDSSAHSRAQHATPSCRENPALRLSVWRAQ